MRPAVAYTACTCGAHRRAQWLALLLGPSGCVLRWLLSQYNYRLPGAARWLPAGTLAANMLGCLTDFVVGVRPKRAHVQVLRVLRGSQVIMGTCIGDCSDCSRDDLRR